MGALAAADKIVTDDIAQMDYYRTVGYFRHNPQPSADLGEIVAGLAPDRERDDERILAVNLGIALDDVAVAPIILERACKRGLGTTLPL